MEALKKIIKTARADFENVGFLKFLVAAGVYIFAAGGLLWLIAGFLPYTGPGIFFVRSLLASSGRVLLAVGLLFAVVKGEELLLMIFSAVISLGALVMMIVELAARNYYATFESWLFMILFGGIVALIIIFGDKFKQMRADAKAASQARAAGQAAQAQQAGAPPKLIACPNCGGPVPFEAAFCPACGAQNPAQMQHAPPPAPPAAAAAAPAAAATAAAAVPPPAPAPTPAPSPTPEPKKTAKPKKAAAPKKAAEPATKACVNCGEQIPTGAAFCGKCGAKQ